MQSESKDIEEWLQSTIRQIDETVKELLIERGILDKRLTTHRLGHSIGQGGRRKNASQRVVVESGILATLGKMKQARSRTMYKEAMIEFPQLNYGTFRGYLCRMKKRGLIIHGIGGGGWWRLKPENLQEQLQKDIAEQLDKLVGKTKGLESH